MNAALNSPLRILLVEDNPNDARLIRRHLTESSSALLPDSIDFAHAESLEAGLATAAANPIDLLLLDLGLPGSEGIETYERVRDRIPEVPVVVLTNLDDDEVAVELLNRGAQDYLNKRSLNERSLIRSVRYTVERWQRQQRHEETEDRYRSLVENSPNPIYVTQEGEVVYVNDAAVALLNAEDRDEVVGANPVAHARPDGESNLKERLRGLEAGESLERTEGAVVANDGAVKYVEAVATPVKWDGQPAHQVLYIDMTERRRRERELAETTRQLRALLDGVEAAVWMRDADSRFIRVNETYRELIGIERSTQVSGKRPAELVDDALSREMRDIDEQVLSTGDHLTFERVHQTESEDRVFLTNVTPVVRDGEVKATVGTATDITAQKDQQRQLEAFERRFDAVFNSPFSFAAVFRPDGTVKQANEVALDMVDATFAEVRGEPVWEIPWWSHSTDVQEDVRGWFEEAADGEFTHWETTCRVWTGRLVVVNGVFQPVTDEDGTVTEVVGMARDITDLRERQQRLSVLNRVLRHNLRNSMNAVRGYANLLSDEVDDGTLRHYTDAIASQTEQLLTISEKARGIQDLFDRSISPSYTCDLRELLAELDAYFEEEYPNVDVSVSLPGSTQVHADERLQRGIREAVANAVIHTDDPAPSISITTSASTVNDPDDWIDVVVADDGPGIPEAERTAIEEGRETQLSHGTGLGLWLMYWITRLIGGQLTIEDRSPRGTRVVFTLSRARTDATDDPDEAQPVD